MWYGDLFKGFLGIVLPRLRKMPAEGSIGAKVNALKVQGLFNQAASPSPRVRFWWFQLILTIELTWRAMASGQNSSKDQGRHGLQKFNFAKSEVSMFLIPLLDLRYRNVSIKSWDEYPSLKKISYSQRALIHEKSFLEAIHMLPLLDSHLSQQSSGNLTPKNCRLAASLWNSRAVLIILESSSVCTLEGPGSVESVHFLFKLWEDCLAGS